jgi:hypothetical protein
VSVLVEKDQRTDMTRTEKRGSENGGGGTPEGTVFIASAPGL